MTLTQAIVLGWAIGVLSFLGIADSREEEIQRQNYCDRVQDWKDSGGEYGWPPFDGEC